MPSIPIPDAVVLWQAMKMLTRTQSILSALQVFHDSLGDIFRLPIPGFPAIVLVGPEANQLLLKNSRDSFLWRAEKDPITRLLRHGILVEDGKKHDELRMNMAPMLHRKAVGQYIDIMSRCTDEILDQWHDNEPIDMFIEMRKLTLLILMESLFKEDIRPYLEKLWPHIMGILRSISPGFWLIWQGIPQRNPQQNIQQLDHYFYLIITQRRKNPEQSDDMLGMMITAGMSDELIRDQILTLFIAGHDTSTALLSWALYLIATHPDILMRLQQEVDMFPDLGNIYKLEYLDRVIKETLRLYPPIHLGSRIAATTIHFRDYVIPAGSRVLYSLYLTHRHKTYWTDPDIFNPDRFASDTHHEAYAYLPFGAGPRNCIGSAFAQIEAKIILARILQRFEFQFVGKSVHPHMGATLEPHPGVILTLRSR
jgi:cytochrome P450